MNLPARIWLCPIVYAAASAWGFITPGPGLTSRLMAAEPVDAAVLAAESARVEVMGKVAPSVLAIFSSTGAGGGSGVVITADGFALTNFHVAKPCGDAMKCGMPNGEVYDAVIVGVDPTGDVALIKLLGRDDFPHVPLGDSDTLRVGDSVFAMGNPFLLATDFQPTVTFGIVSGVRRYQPPAGTLLEYTDCIQTDASINPGNSGGPLFNMRGELVGINGRGSFEKRGRVNVGVAYAISINQIKNFLGHLHSGRIVDHATLGAVVAFDDRGRVVVSDILEESDAYRRGLRIDDEMVTFAGRPITTPNAFKNVLGIYPKGWQVPLGFRRDGERYEILVRLRGMHGSEELIEKTEGTPKAVPMPIPQPEPDKGPGDDSKKPAPKRLPLPDMPKLPGSDENTAYSATAHVRSATADLLSATDQPANDRRRLVPGVSSSADADSSGNTANVVASDQPAEDEKGEKGQKQPPRSKKGEGKDRRIEVPPGMRPSMPKPPMPDTVKQVFEEKRGFANYHFNKQHQQRVWQAWLRECDLSDRLGTWEARGALVGGGTFEMTLDDDSVKLVMPTNTLTWSPGEKLSESLDPPQSGGMFLALYLWQRMNRLGIAGFGDVYYLGTCPLPGRAEPVDVLVATHKAIECRFYFDPSSGRMLAMEMYPEPEVDPAELFFHDYRETDGQLMPGRIEARYGNDVFTMMGVEEWTLEKKAK